MKELCRNVHSSKIGFFSHGRFVPKIYYNFELEVYVCSDTVKVSIPLPQLCINMNSMYTFHADIFYLKSDAAGGGWQKGY